VSYEDDPTRGKDRPVLLIGRRGAHLVGVALTSKQHSRDQVELGVGAWDKEGRISYAKIDRLIDVDPAAVRREGAALDKKRFAVLIARIKANADALA
jgi:PemK-like, MazF-like toxin of type II toxin-antitoxin system